MMQSKTDSHKNAYYRVIRTTEQITGNPTVMYGIEGFSDNEVVTVAALSEERERVKRLVSKLNECGLQLCHLRDVIDDFLYEYYGIGVLHDA